jgi:dienelactone hydrolase
LTPQEIKVEDLQVLQSGLSYQLLSFRLNGLKQYAGVIIPETKMLLPVSINIYGFALDVPLSYQNIKLSPSSDTAKLPFIFVLPALRGQSLSLTINDKTYTSPVSEGSRDDAFDGAADDALACLNAVIANYKNADSSRVMARGGSRGGTVALLMAERDKRIKRAAGVAFPADLIGLTANHQTDATYKFQFLDALTKGSATREQTRMKMIASSPLYFCERLPKTQVHFGDNDKITPATEGQLIVNAMKSKGLETNIESFVYNGRSHENIGTNNTEMEDRIQSFFRQLW